MLEQVVSCQQPQQTVFIRQDIDLLWILNQSCGRINIDE